MFSTTAQPSIPPQPDLLIFHRIPFPKEYSTTNERIAQMGNSIQFSTCPVAPLASQQFLYDSSISARFLFHTGSAPTLPYCTTCECHLPLYLQFQQTRWSHCLPTPFLLHLDSFSSNLSTGKPPHSSATASISQPQRIQPSSPTPGFFFVMSFLPTSLCINSNQNCFIFSFTAFNLEVSNVLGLCARATIATRPQTALI